jgi:hypothetical protein
MARFEVMTYYCNTFVNTRYLLRFTNIQGDNSKLNYDLYTHDDGGYYLLPQVTVTCLLKPELLLTRRLRK